MELTGVKIAGARTPSFKFYFLSLPRETYYCISHLLHNRDSKFLGSILLWIINC